MQPSAFTGFESWQSLRGLSPRTIERRRWTLDRWQRHLDPLGPFDATLDHVESFLAALPTAQSRYSLRADLHQFYRWAIRRGIAAYDPTDLTDPPKVPQRLPTPIPTADVRRAVAASAGPLRLMVMFGAFAGLRVSEIAAVAGRDVHDDVLVVRQGKGGRDRTVPVHPFLAIELAGVPVGALFPGATGPSVSERIRRHFRRLGIDARPHDLRHSFGTEVARVSGGNIVLVQQLLGHSSPATTQRYVGWAAPGAATVSAMYR